MNYSIHTFILERYLDYEEFYNIISTFYKELNSSYRIYHDKNNHNTVYINKYKGIKITLIKLKHNFCETKYLIQITVNLKSLCEPDNITDLFDKRKDNFFDSMENLNKILFDINKYSIDDFILKRVDLTFDLKFSDIKIPGEIILLARKSKMPQGFKFKYYPGETTQNGKKIVYTNSYDIINEKKGIEFSIYNKYNQLININKNPDAEYINAIESAKTTLRIELRILSLPYMPDISGNIQALQFLLNEGEIGLKHYINSVFFKGTFYKSKKVKTMLLEVFKNNLISNSEHKNAVEILKILTNKNRYSHLKKYMSNYKIGSGLKALDLLNINPITIGANRSVNEIPDIQNFL